MDLIGGIVRVVHGNGSFDMDVDWQASGNEGFYNSVERVRVAGEPPTAELQGKQVEVRVQKRDGYRLIGIFSFVG